ncbi:MAG: DUF262 domain-containing protein [Hyphomicrobiaceae bacterium]|nr:DUF262 domain-containing protein [Hyphomicrobiaceae bacterium]
MTTQPKLVTLFRAAEENLHSVFKEQRYEVPFYQRPYAWEKEQAEDLFDDLLNASTSTKKGEDTYFLGSIVLFDGGSSGRHKIIDGQQRLVTLQLLLLAISQVIRKDKDRDELLAYVRSTENVFAGTKSEPVVTVSEKYQKFFSKLVYAPDDVEKVDMKTLSKPEYNMLENYTFFKDRIKIEKKFDPVRFGVFIMQRCLVASLRATQEESALRIFTVLNDRGVDLHPVDILKARLISSSGAAENVMEKYAREWEETEYSLGRAQFLQLFNYIRMIYVKSRPKKLLHEEVLEELSTRPKVRSFLDDELHEYADLYAEILNPKDPALRALVKVLEATAQRDWVAPTLYLLRNRDELGESFLALMQKLTAISMAMLCVPFTEGQRVGRYGRIIAELDELVAGGLSPEKLTHINATEDEVAKMELNLAANAYELRNIKAFLLWSETLIGDGERSIESGPMTVEHVLPNVPGSEPYWLNRFPNGKWEELSNNIGNLCLVSSRMNAKLARRDFPAKVEIIQRRSRTGWALTDEITDSNDWTPAAISDRASRIIKRAKGVMTTQLPPRRKKS